MVVDSSALIGILQKEPESGRFRELLAQAPLRIIAAPTLFETTMIVLSRQREQGLTLLREFVADARIETVPFDADHAELALEAFRRFGRGRHRAGLNLGDCISYALASATGEPLLFKGDDFIHTDVKGAA